MASVTHVVTVRDSTVVSGENRMTGLTLAWTHLKKLSDNTNATQPSFTEIANGQYKFTYDADTSGEAAGMIDAGATLDNFSDRYIDVLLAIDSGRVQTALPNAVAGASTGLLISGTNSGTTTLGALTVTGGTTLGPVSITNSSGGVALDLSGATGMRITGTNGNALRVSSSGGNGHGFHVTGNGTGSGFHAQGGTTGNGMLLTGGTTSGDGLSTSVTNASDMGFRGNITGNITGSVSGSVGSVTGAVGSVTGAVGSVGTGGITAASIASNAIDADSIATDAVTEIQSGLATAASLSSLETRLRGMVIAQGTIGATNNSTTTLHLTGLTYSDDEINNWLIVIYDVSTNEYHSRWIEDYSSSTALATVSLLPFTPQNSTDTYWILPVRQDVTGGSGLDAAGVRAAIGLATANLDTQLSAIESQTDDIGTAGAGLTAIPWNAAWDAEVQSEVQDAIEVNHLDHLLAADYDPANKPGVATALLNEIIENDAGVSRYTTNALEQAPSTPGGGTATIGNQETIIEIIQAIAGNQDQQ
jgi:hypothetical protein